MVIKIGERTKPLCVLTNVDHHKISEIIIMVIVNSNPLWGYLPLDINIS